VSVSIVLVRAFVEVVEHAGFRRDELLQGTQIAPESLDATAARVPFADFARLEARALDLTADEALGLHIAERATEAAFDLIGHLVAHAPTLRECIELCVRFQRVLADESELTLEDPGPARGGLAMLRLRFPRTTRRVDRLFAEFVMAGLMRMIRNVAGPSAMARAVYFEHAIPPHEAEVRRVFGGVERFRQAFTGIDVDGAVLDRPHLHHHPELQQVLQSQAERALERLTRGVGQAERLKQYLLARPPLAVAPDMEVVARDLGMSVRSLRRRLTEEGVSYKEVVNEALGKAATWMLDDSRRTIQETAHAMGFSDPTAFHRAFKRWTGMTPKEYRAKRDA
jgi:AraC-like DNA-binding protein